MALFERTLTDRERLLGAEHPDTLTSRHNLANAYQQAGRLEEATHLFTAQPN
jgi:Tetratricopeptide repeat